MDEDGFCKDLLAVQGMGGAMVARQVSAVYEKLPSHVYCTNSVASFELMVPNLVIWSGLYLLREVDLCAYVVYQRR